MGLHDGQGHRGAEGLHKRTGDGSVDRRVRGGVGCRVRGGVNRWGLTGEGPGSQEGRDVT